MLCRWRELRDLLKRKFAIFLLVICTVVISILLSPIIDSFFSITDRDENAFIYVAKGILEGEVPYLDRWDHKGPLIYALNLAGLAISGSWGIWIVLTIFLLSSSWFLFLAMKQNFGIFPSLFSVSIFLIYLERFQPGNFTEYYSLLFQFVTLYLFARVEWRNRRESWLPLAIGVLGGCAFLLRPNLVGIWLAVGLYWVPGTRALNRLSWSIAGGVGIIAAAAAVFAVVGGLSAFWDAAVIYNLAYIDASLADRIDVARQIREGLSPIFPLIVAGWCIGFGYWLLGRTRDERYHDLLSMSLILLPLEIALACVSGFGYGHYYMAVLPAITVFMAYSARLVIHFVGLLVKEHFATKEYRVAPTFLIIAFLLVTVVSFDHILQLAGKYTRAGTVAQSRHSRVAELVRSATEPGDRILVWGAEPLVYLLSERTSPTRFFFQFPLVKPGYANRSLVDEFISAVKDEMPAMIIDTRNRRLPPLEETARRDWRPEKRYVHDPDAFQPLFGLVEAEYEVVGKDGNWILYGRKLPDKDIGGIRTGQVDREGNPLWEAEHWFEESRQWLDGYLSSATSGEPAARGVFDIYLGKGSLIFVKDPCARVDTEAKFFLHLIPADEDDLPEERKQHGFDNLDFNFEVHGVIFYDKCLATVPLPEYGISEIRTGQFLVNEDGGFNNLWKAEFRR